MSEESIGEPDPEDDGLSLLATGDAASSNNDPPNGASRPAKNLRRGRVYVETSSEKRARMEEPSVSS